MAVGLACAGSGLREAVGLLEPLLTDPTDFVRQVRGVWFACMYAFQSVLHQELYLFWWSIVYCILQ